jgi:hypothetical protein
MDHATVFFICFAFRGDVGPEPSKLNASLLWLINKQGHPRAHAEVIPLQGNAPNSTVAALFPNFRLKPLPRGSLFFTFCGGSRKALMSLGRIARRIIRNSFPLDNWALR